MLLIRCPWCGDRPETEYLYGADATKTRPAPDAGADAWHDFVYLRDNPRGPHREYWQHSAGCRRWLIVTRNTLTMEITAVEDAGGKSGAAA